MTPLYISESDVEAVLGISRAQLRRLVREDGLASAKIGRGRVWRTDDVRAAIERRATGVDVTALLARAGLRKAV